MKQMFMEYVVAFYNNIRVPTCEWIVIFSILVDKAVVIIF